MNTQQEYNEEELRIIRESLNALANRYRLDGRYEKMTKVDRIVSKTTANIVQYVKGDE